MDQVQGNNQKQHKEAPKNNDSALVAWTHNLLIEPSLVPPVPIALSVTTPYVKVAIGCKDRSQQKARDKIEQRYLSSKLMLGRHHLISLFVCSCAQVIVNPLINIEEGSDSKQHRG